MLDHIALIQQYRVVVLLPGWLIGANGYAARCDKLISMSFCVYFVLFLDDSRNFQGNFLAIFCDYNN